MSNYSYAWRHGWKWALKSGNTIAFVRTLWLAYVLGSDGESCQDCGRRYVLWYAPDKLYRKVHGNSQGLLCPSCFDKQAATKGIRLKWIPEEYKLNLFGPEIYNVHYLPEHHYEREL